MNPINHLNLEKPERYYFTQSTKIERLPIDLLTKIFDFLHLKEFSPLNVLNRNFNENIFTQIVGQKGWFTRKFQETLHIKFQNDTRQQYIRRFAVETISENHVNTITVINVPSNKNKQTFDEKIINILNNEGPSTCQQANEVVKKIFSCFIGANTCVELERVGDLNRRVSGDRNVFGFSLASQKLEVALKSSSSSKEEVSHILLESFLLFEKEWGDLRRWYKCYRDSPFKDSSLAMTIFNLVKASQNPMIEKKTAILCTSLLRNRELIDEAYKIAYQVFESDYKPSSKLMLACMKINPELALEFFERYKNKHVTRNSSSEQSVLDLLAACVSVCPELATEGFEIAKKKFGQSRLLDSQALELLVTCIEANPSYGLEGLDLVKSSDYDIILKVLLIWGNVDPFLASRAIYEYLGKINIETINKLKSVELGIVKDLIIICINNCWDMPDFFERLVPILLQKEFHTFFLCNLDAMVHSIPTSPLDKKKFDLLFKITSFFSSPHEILNLTNIVFVLCDANARNEDFLVLAKETIKNIKKLGNENVITTIFLSLLEHNPMLAEFILKEIEQLVEGKKINNLKLKQNLLIGCVLADSELSPEIATYIQGWTQEEKHEVLDACNSSKRKFENEVGKNKEVKGNEFEID